MESISANAIDKNIEFLFDYDPESPKQVMGDPARIRQILTNLLGNAIKFTETGYILMKIGSVRETDGSTLFRIEVSDSGIGIKHDSLASLFDKFTQADQSTTRKFGGTGLGLAITKNSLKRWI